jgi:putative thioredoxin
MDLHGTQQTGASGGSAAAVIDVGVENFQREVVDRSRQVPVLIDFWATWCGPCKTLGPILEKVARELGGKLVLAKIDVDKNPEIADLFQIQSVPTVMLLVDARPVDGFMGAQPEPQVRKFLERHLGVAAPDPLKEAEELEQEGRRGEAADVLRAHLQREPGDAKARVMHARLLVAEGRVEEARKVFAKVEGEALETPEAAAVRAQLDAAGGDGEVRAGEVEALERAVAERPDDIAARIALGKRLVAAGRHERGLEELLEAAKADIRFDGDAPRKALIEVFNLLGQSDPLVLDYQRRLSMLLCV